MKKSKLSYIILIFIVASIFIGSGLLSIIIGQDANWDLRNYHIYVPYSIVNNRIGVDIAPAHRQSYINPALDMMYYGGAFALNAYPRLFAFLYALPFGACALLLFWIAWRVFAGALPVLVAWQNKMPETLAAVAIGASGVTGQGTLGSTMNEAQTTLFVLAALLLGVMRLQSAEIRPVLMFCLGLCVGVAGGLKLSYAPHGIAIGVALLPFVLSRRIGLGELLLSGLGVLLGLLVSLGPWALLLYTTFENPLFPFFNDIFQSPYAEAERWSDDRFIPENWREAVLFPFIWAFGDRTVASEMPFRDLRFVTTIGLATIAAVCMMVFGKVRQKGLDRMFPLGFLAIYWVLAYVVWAGSFGIYRYALPLEMLSGVFIVAAVMGLMRLGLLRRVALFVLVGGLFLTTSPVNWGRVPFGDKVLAAETMAVPENSVVVLLGDRPMAYLLAFMPKDTLAIGLESNFLTSEQDNLLTRRAEEVLRTHEGPLWLATLKDRIPDSPLLARAGVWIIEETCIPVVTSLSPPGDPLGVRLCRMQRDASKS